MKKIKGVLSAFWHGLITWHQIREVYFSGPSNGYHQELTELTCLHCDKVFYKREDQ